MAYRLMKLFSWFVCSLPLGLQKMLGAWIGEFTWLLVPQNRKKMAMENIILCLKVQEKEAAVIAKESWTRFGRMIIEVLKFPEIKKNIDQYVSLQGREHMEKALSYGRGVVLATAHSGNWELLGGALALHGFPIVGVAQKQTSSDMDRLINEYRQLIGMHVTYKQGVREMIQLLGKGYVIGLLMDQDAGKDGVELEFFGRTASCPQGPAFLARLKNAPIVPTFITENSDGIHTVMMQEPFFIEQTEDKHEDIKRTTEKLTRMIEDHIRKYPTEWFWMHDRWKSTRNK